jgi:nuclear protein localization family protein 4
LVSPGLSNGELVSFGKQLTHGFVKQPRPLFKSLEFPIENRLDSHQTLEKPARQIRQILPSLDSLEAVTIDDLTQDQRAALVKAFSDWHLFAFLPESGLFDEVSCVETR